MPSGISLVEGANQTAIMVLIEKSVSLEKNWKILTLTLFIVNCGEEASLGTSTR